MNLERISGRAVLDRQLAALCAADPRLGPVLAGAGEVPLRLREGGFAGLAQVVVAQLLSVASAGAIQARVEAVVGTMRADRFMRVDPISLRAAGLSAAKIATLRVLAEAELGGLIDYDALADMAATDAVNDLTRFKGIGRWSAEIYLLFSTGHPDIFPAGDLALRKAVGQVLNMPEASEHQVRAAAERWTPWRGAAARLMWRHYALVNRREGVG